MTDDDRTRTTACRQDDQRPMWLALLLGTCAAFVVLATVPQQAPASTGFSVAPLRFDVDVSPGKSTTKTIKIKNTLPSRTTFTVSKEDISGSKSDPASSPILLGGVVDSPISGANWLNPSTTSFSLASGASRTINVTITAPSDATGGHYAALTIASNPTRLTDSLVATSRVAVLFLMNAGSVPPPELIIDNVTVTKDGKTLIEYRNVGEKATTPDAEIRYVDQFGNEVSASPKTKCSTALPDSLGRCEVESAGPGDDRPRVTKGLISLKDPSEGVAARAETPLQWSGSKTSLLLPLIGMGLLVIYFWRLRRRDEEELDDDLFPAT